MEPGVYTNISSKEYHDMTDIVSNSYLGRLDKCPASVMAQQKDTPALLFGRALHSFVLEGMEKFIKDFAVAPQCDRRTKEGKEIWELFEMDNQGKGIIKEEDFEIIQKMDNAIKTHPFAKRILASGISEQTVIWVDEETGIKCKCRPDRTAPHNTLVDLKKTKDAGSHAFQRSIVTYGYARQAGMYLEGISIATKKNYDSFCFIAVEDVEPYRVEVYTLDQQFVAWGAREFHRLLNLEKKCRESKKYPHYKTGGAVNIFKPSYLGETNHE